MKTVNLSVSSRDTGARARRLRRERQIPAVLYGHGEPAAHVQIVYQDFRKVYQEAGTSQLIDLSVDGKDPKKVLIHDLQQHPLHGTIEHVDFLMVNLKEKVTTHVPVKIEGESRAVKDLGGILNVVKHELEVRCLPLEIPHDIVVNVSELNEFSASVHVSELTIPEGVELLDSPEDVVVIVNAPRLVEEEEETTTEEEGEGAEGEKAEGEAAEGEEKSEEGAEKGKEASKE